MKSISCTVKSISCTVFQTIYIIIVKISDHECSDLSTMNNACQSSVYIYIYDIVRKLITVIYLLKAAVAYSTVPKTSINYCLMVFYILLSL